MKKRLLCALLAAAMCFGETLSASAVTVSTNDVEMEQTGTISENATEVDAAGDATELAVYPDGDIACQYAWGHNAELKLLADPKKKNCSAVIYDENGERQYETLEQTGDAPSGRRYAEVTLDLKIAKLPVGKYKLKYWAGTETSNGNTVDIQISKSIEKSVRINISEPEISNIVYTGKEVKPVVKIVEKQKDKEYTLVEGKDFKWEFEEGGNTKELGTVKGKITGINDYMGEISGQFDIIPQTPAITSAVCTGYNSAKITWNAVPYVCKYVVERKAGNGSFAQIATLDEKTRGYEDSNLSTGDTYYYRIVAQANSKSNANERVESERNANGVAIKITPSVPKLISLESITYNKLKLTWNAVDGATGYWVYQIKQDGSYKYVKTVAASSAAQVSTTIAKLRIGQTYRYTVKAYTLASDSVTKIVSSCDEKGLSAKAKPATPKVTSMKSTDYNKISVRWKKVTKAYGYYVYRREVGNEDSTWKRVKKVKYGSTTSTIDMKAETGVKYVYAVKAYTVVNGKKIFSDMVKSEKSVRAIPKKPTYTAIQSGSSIDVNIKKVAGADGYYVYRKEGNGKYRRIATVDAKKNASVTAYKDNKIQIGKTYSYLVRAYKQTDESRVMSGKSKVLTLTTK